MLQILVFSDVHTFTDNIRLAIDRIDRVDAILIAGDLEAEENLLKAAAGDIPCYAVCGNCDYYLTTDYPEELLIDIADHPGKSSGSTAAPTGSSEPSDAIPGDGQPQITKIIPEVRRYPAIGKVTALHCQDLPGKISSLPPLVRKYAPKAALRGLTEQKKPSHISHRILMTHGNEYGVPDLDRLARRAALYDADIVIFGHTHRSFYTEERHGSTLLRFLNPGCLAGNPNDTVRSYGSFDICTYSLLRFGLEGEVSVQQLHL